MSAYSPVVLFAYNRPDHTRLVLEALSKNPEASETCLYIYIDGPMQEADSDALSRINAVRSLVRESSWCGEVNVIESLLNKGLAQSIIDGVTEVVKRHGRVIVLEDDLVCSSSFLRFMNDFLNVYESDETVISATGYVYPVESDLPETFFLRGADCWGWATWKRGWDLFESNGQKLLDILESEGRCSDFDFNESYPYTKMLRDQIAGLNSSWAIRWYASAFLNEKLTLYPGRSLIHNIGNDGSGVHCAQTKQWDVKLENNCPNVGEVDVCENLQARAAFQAFFLIGKKKLSLFKKIFRTLKKKGKRV
jgi:hypothetical protein